jgi:hypothetical protein
MQSKSWKIFSSLKLLGKSVRALIISKSFNSLLIGCVRRPTTNRAKESSGIADNMITFNGGRRMQPISKLLNDLLITSALNPTCLLQSALNSTGLLQVL